MNRALKVFHAFIGIIVEIGVVSAFTAMVLAALTLLGD